MKAKIKDLIPDDANFNTGTEFGNGLIEKSLSKFGAGRSILIDKNNRIIAGNKTIENAAQLGLENVRIIETDGSEIVAVKRTDIDLDSKRGREMALADNATAKANISWDAKAITEWEMPAMEWGIDLQTVEPAGTADAEPQIDKAAELNKKWKVKTGDLWQIGEHRLLCGDSTKREDVERLMQGEKADCVFTSPPYAVGLDYGDTYQDTIENLRAMLPELSQRWLEILEPGGFAVINFGDVASGRNITETEEPCEYPMALEYYPIFRADGWLLWSRRIWCKPNPRVNSMQCIQSNRAATDWEHLWTFKSPGKAIIERVDGDLRSSLGWIDTSLMTGVEVGKDSHGAGMASGIAQWMLNVHSRPQMPIYEPFCGTGTTMVAAENLKRHCRASELNPDYCAVILERMATAFPSLEIKRIEQASAAKS